MALRSTQTWVSVLGGNTGKLRATKTWVAVLTDNIEKGFAVESEMVLVSSFHSSRVQENVAHSIELVQTASSNPKQENVASTLNLVQELDSSIKMLSVSSSLDLDSEGHSGLITLSASSTIDLEHEAEGHGEITYSLSSFLELESEATEHFGIANLSVQHHLEFVDDENPFLEQFVNLTYELALEDTLVLFGEVDRVHAVTDVMVINQTVTFSYGISVETELELVGDIVDYNGILGRSVASPLDIDHGVAFFIERDEFLCQYAPFIGANGDGGETTPPSATPPTLGTATLTLTWPFMTPTTTLVLRNPEFGDTHDFAFSRIVRETRGGSLEVFADPDWSKTQVLNLTVEGLTEDETNDFLDFLGDSLGQEIGLLDWYNRQWRGIITTPDAEVTDAGNCRKSITFEFEGELV